MDTQYNNDPFAQQLAIEAESSDPFAEQMEVEKQAPIEQPAPRKAASIMGLLSKARDPVRATLQGTTLGFSDELGSAIGAGAAKVAQGVGSVLPDTAREYLEDKSIIPLQTDESIGDIYSGMQEQVDAEQRQYAKENPYTSIGLELAGSVPTALVGGAKLLQAGAKLKPIAGAVSKAPVIRNALAGGAAIAEKAPLVTKIAKGAASAAPLGAAYGAGTAKQGERIEGAKTGGLVAGAFGGALPAGGAALKYSKSKISPVWQALRKEAPEKADEIIARMFQKSGLSPDDFSKKIDDLGLEAVAADVDEDILGQAQAALSKSSGLKSEIADALHKRQTGQQADFVKSFTDELGDAGGDNLRTALEKTAKKRSAQASPLYKKAFATEFAEDLSKNKVLRLPNVQKALKAGEEMAKNDPKRIATKGALSPAERLHYAKKSLYDSEQSMWKLGKSSEARTFKKQRQAVDDILNTIPEYKEARNIWSSSLDREAAADIGKNIMKPGVDAEDFIYEFKKLGDSESEMAKLSALKEIIKKIETKPESGSITSQLKGTGLQKKARAMFGSDEAFNNFVKKISKWDTFERTRNRATAGRQSITQPNLAEGEINTKNLKDALPSVEGILDKLLGKVAKASAEDVNKEVARKLLTKKGIKEVQNALSGKPKQAVITADAPRHVLPKVVASNRLAQEL